jgi:CRISPR type III-A-associated RAMP protein Csm4
VESAFRLLADSGIGGERSRGWGRSAEPEFTPGSLPEMILAPWPETAQSDENGEPAPQPETAWWLLSLFSPSAGDQVDWRRGDYALAVRTGRIESGSGWGLLKLPARLVAEGSVILAASPPVGAAANVAPEGLPHPVYRAGFAVAIPIPYRGAA